MKIGDKAIVTQLIEQGQEPHEFEIGEIVIIEKIYVDLFFRNILCKSLEGKLYWVNESEIKVVGNINEFYRKITEWLLPLDYVEIFSNHPFEYKREFHFIKDNIRVCCVNDSDEDYFYLSTTLFAKETLTLQSGKYSLNNDVSKLNEIISAIKSTINAKD